MRRLLAALLALPCIALANPALHGTWSAANVNGRPLLVQFDANGTGKVNGQPMKWQAFGHMLALEQNGSAAMYQFQVEGSSLKVAGGDLQGIATLTKGSAAYDAAIKAQPSKPAAGAAPAQGGGQTGGQELVGKWCKLTNLSGSGGSTSRSECFELRPDGNYVYGYQSSMSVQAGSTASESSDAGRWSYNGSQLVAQSRSGRTYTYNLEKRNHPKNRNDPMICLDGTCYVTFFNKPAWR